MPDAIFDIVLSGVGGQGVVTASEILARAALAEGADVKKSEVHGMAQRGGSVESQVRIGPRVHSPVIPEGGAGFMVGFEMLEALRYAHRLMPGGTVILNMLEIPPLSAASGPFGYPDDVGGRLAGLGLRVVGVPAREIAIQAGDARAAGSVLLGVLSVFLPFKPASWGRGVHETFGDGVAELNMEAFRMGRTWAKGKGPG